MIIPEISEEQNNIINHLKNNNIIVDSVAGSGKTTTNLYISKFYKNKKILLLTYNSILKLETRRKVKLLKINNLETHSYHSFCVKYYNCECFTDTEIKNIVANDTKYRNDIIYDIILLDEAQDITYLYYELICKVYKDNDNKNTQICLLGDKNQSIYDFNNADERYIIYADQIFNFNNLFWKKCTLSISFRVTDKIADFINNCMLQTNRIIATKKSNYIPKYIICNTFPYKYDLTAYKPYIEIQNILNLGYKPNEIFILAPSLKSIQSPVRLFENYLKKNNPSIPIYVPSSDDEKMDEEIIKNKLLFSTFHQAKGLERKVVIIFGFDNGYFKYYKKNKNTLLCPNELYVATTRAIEYLVMIHHSKNDYLPFLNKSKLSNYTTISGNVSDYIDNDIIKNETDIQVTNIIKHLSQDVIDKCFNYLEIKNIRKIDKKINILHKIKNGNLCESITEINGIAIPSFFEYKKTNQMSILNYCIKPNKLIFDNSINKPLKEFWEQHIKNLKLIKKKELIEENLLYVATIYNSLNSKYLFKSYQIKDFDWLDNDILYKCLERFNSLKITKKAQMEISCSLSNLIYNDVAEILNKKIIGRYDCLDDNTIYEFKCTEKLEKQHYLQLAIYMYIHQIKILRKDLEIKKKNIIKGLDILHINNKLKYKIDNSEETGFITKIFKNGNINIKNLNTNKINKINKINIINNLTYEKNNKPKDKYSRYLLYNILTDQLDEIFCDIDKLKEMIKILFYEKFINNKIISDTDFRDKVLMIKNKFKI